ncbi:MAG: hypothetical protein V8R40_10430 [Dysosmobacter sp.]
MLNQHLLEAVMGKSPSLRVVFSAYKDFTCILLCPSESGVYKFPKSGRIKDIAFSRSPVEAGSPCRPATRRRGIHTQQIGGRVGYASPARRRTGEVRQSECLEKERRKAWGLMRSRERHENWVRVFHVFLAFSREGLQRSGVRLVREEFAGNVGPACWEAPCTYPAYEVCCS